MMLVPALATALVYGVGGHLAISGTLTVGTLLALATLLLRLLGPLQGLSNVRIDVMTALVSFERVFEVLDLPSPDRGEARRRRAARRPPSRLEFDHVAFTLPARRRGLAGLARGGRPHRVPRHRPGAPRHHFVAEPGQMVALVGPSGAGKTTITHLVARLYDVGSGAVRVGGHDVRDVTLQSLEDVVGYVTQDAHMFHDTIRANLLYARPGADDREVWAALEAAQIADLVRALPDGLDTVVGDRGYRLSGGERQRLAIARLLLKAPADRRPRRGDRPPRLRVRGRRPAGPRRGPRGPHRRWSSRTGSRRSATPTRSSSSTTAGSSSAAPTPSCSREGGLYADLYRTQFVDDVPA